MLKNFFAALLVIQSLTESTINLEKSNMDNSNDVCFDYCQNDGLCLVNNFNNPYCICLENSYGLYCQYDSRDGNLYDDLG